MYLATVADLRVTDLFQNYIIGRHKQCLCLA